jgi:hypothetical protein
MHIVFETDIACSVTIDGPGGLFDLRFHGCLSFYDDGDSLSFWALPRSHNLNFISPMEITSRINIVSKCKFYSTI